MVEVAVAVAHLGGMAQKRQLICLGARDRDLTRAVRAGAVYRPRQGWYSTLPPTDLAVRAVRVGGRLTGISALVAAGAWALGPFPLHVSLHANAARLRSQWLPRGKLESWFSSSGPGSPAPPPVAHRTLPFEIDSRGVRLHWDNSTVARGGSVTSVAIHDALLRVVLDESLETAVAAIDWALRTGRLDGIELEELILRLPSDRRGIRSLVDPRCDSLPESLARTRLRLRGHSVVSQVIVSELERIDLLVDDCVAVEVDGEQFHRERFEADRNKDLAITIAGFHAIRPTARMVFSRWCQVEQGIETAISARQPTETSSRQPLTAGLTRSLRGWRNQRAVRPRAP